MEIECPEEWNPVEIDEWRREKEERRVMEEVFGDG